MSAGFVEYFERNTIIDLNPYMKNRELFDYQNEFRLCANTSETEVNLFFDLKRDLRDIVIPIKTDIFLNSLKAENNCNIIDNNAIMKNI